MKTDMIVASYSLSARSGAETELRDALGALGSWLNGQGCTATHVLQDSANALEFLFLEFWSDEDARAAAGKVMDKGLMAPVMAALADRPVARSYRAFRD